MQGRAAVTSVAFSPDGTRIVSGSLDNTLRLWQSDSGEVLSLLELDSSVLAVAWHGDSVALETQKRLCRCSAWSSRTIRSNQVFFAYPRKKV
jgi:WD40 repeat protein